MKIENDFGKTPLLLAHIIRDRGVIGVAMLLISFVGVAIGGVPLGALLLFAGVNDVLYAKEHEDDDSNRQFLPHYNYEEEYDADTGSSYPIGNYTRFNALDVPSVDVDDEPLTTRDVFERYQSAQIQEYQPSDRRQLRIDVDLGENIESTFIVGVPGSGKGVLFSNAVRVAKSKHPGIKIMGIDPANKPNETGYWSQGFDIVRRCRIEDLSPANAAAWLWECIEEFKKLPSPKLLLFDEAVIACKLMKSAPNKMIFQQFSAFVTAITSNGDGRNEFLYFVSQIPHAGEIGMSQGTLSLFNRKIAIVSARNMASTNNLLNTRFVPVPSKEAVLELMEKSPVMRAYFDSKYNSWFPMPTLHNHSGFNRDVRSFEEVKVEDKSVFNRTESKASRFIKSLENRTDSDAQMLLGFVDFLNRNCTKTLTVETIRSSYWAKKFNARDRQKVMQCIQIALLNKMIQEVGQDTYRVLDF